MARENCKILGTISKTHGVRGELIIRTNNLSFEPDENWESLFLQIDGILVPFFISSIHVFNNNDWIVCFDDYQSKNSAAKLIGSTVWIQVDLIESIDVELFTDELTGYEIINITSGRHGVIVGFMDIPGNPVFEVEIMGEKIMIPAQNELIQEIDSENQSLTVCLPEGIM